MYKKNKILAIIPARGGSKGLKRKNVIKTAGKPLIAWTIAAARNSKYLDRVILSSDDAEIISVARKCGCEVPFVRPRALAGDKTPSIAPVLHAIESLRESYDYIVLLQPTSPLRSAGDIDACIEKCISGKHQACVSVKEVEENPYWMFTLDKRSSMKPLVNTGKLKLRRQDLPKVYSLNGAVYVTDRRALVKGRAFILPDTAACEMPAERSLDIDTPEDLEKAAAALRRRASRG